MRNQFINWEVPAFAVFSAERASLSPLANIQRARDLSDWLTSSAHDHAAVSGCYNGARESGQLVLLYDGLSGQAWQDCVMLAAQYGQESILYVDDDRQAFLFSLATSEFSSVGAWKETTQAHAESLPAYTIGPEGRYWIAVPKSAHRPC